MDAKIKAFTGIDKSQKVVNEIIFCENDTIEAWELPAESFSKHHPAFSNFYEIELEMNDDKDEDSTYRTGKKAICLRPVNWNDMMKASYRYLYDKICSNGNKDTIEISDISDIDNELDNSIEGNTRKNAAAMRTAHYSVAANTADFAIAQSSGELCVAASTGDFTAAYVVLDGSAAVNTGWGCTTISRSKHSAAVSVGHESISICCGDVSTNFEEIDDVCSEDMGEDSVAVCLGKDSTAIVNGRRTVAVTVGDSSLSECTGESAVSVALGKNSVAYAASPESSAYATANCSWAKGKIGSALHFDERTIDGKLLHTAAVIVDGEKIKEDVLYTLKNGIVTEVDMPIAK